MTAGLLELYERWNIVTTCACYTVRGHRLRELPRGILSPLPKGMFLHPTKHGGYMATPGAGEIFYLLVNEVFSQVWGVDCMPPGWHSPPSARHACVHTRKARPPDTTR